MAAVTTASAAITTVRPTDNLQQLLNAAADGDTLLLQAGTYRMTNNEPWFHVDRRVFLRGAAGVVLQPDTGSPIGIEVRASGTVVEGITIAATGFGVAVRSPAGGVLNGVVLRGITVMNAQTGHGILLERVTDSLIDSCLIVKALYNGIFLDQSSARNVVVNNTVQETVQQHAIAIKNSDSNSIAGNTISGSGFHGILVLGGQFNRLEKNTISGQRFDGITLTVSESGRRSVSNYVGQNRIGPNTQRTDGTSIWITDGTRGTYVFGNTVNGAVEGSISVFDSTNTAIVGNAASGSGQAGIILWHTVPGNSAPVHTLVLNNYVHDILANAGVLMRGAVDTVIGSNWFSNSPQALQITAWTTPVGPSGPSNGIRGFLNTFRNLDAGVAVGGETVDARFWQNRFLDVRSNFSISPASVAWDGDVILGGNYWSDAPQLRPYDRFITEALTGQRGGMYQDRYPYPNESLGGRFAVQVITPIDGQIVAQGTPRTIAWKSSGCALVDLYYESPQNAGVLIANNYPDVGYFQWSPGGQGAMNPGPGYRIRVECKTSAGSGTGVSGYSPLFTVATSDLTLLSPGNRFIARSGQSLRVAWKSTTAFAVDVLFRYDGGSWSTLASNITESSTVVTLPGVNSNHASIAVRASANSNVADSVDATFIIRSGAALVTTPSVSNNTFLVGDVVPLEWISPQDSAFVSIDQWDPVDSAFHPVVADTPDYGTYPWALPDAWTHNAYLRITFKAADGASLGSVNSVPFDITYTSTPGFLTSVYRFYSPASGDHVYTINPAERDALRAGGWNSEGVIGQVMTGPATISGVAAAPLYRFYHSGARQHLWTASRAEYYVIRSSPGWWFEGIAGYAFPQPVAGTKPLYRVLAPPLTHLWTADTNEISFLTSAGWRPEGIAGYIF